MSIEQMIKENIVNTPPSGIRKYFDLINDMKDAISLGIGEPDFETPEYPGRRYTLSREEPLYVKCRTELRREISRYMKDRFNLAYQY